MTYDSFHIDKGRVVISSGGGCDHGCVYCISNARKYKPKERNQEEILGLLKALCQEPSLETIQIGYDAEPFKHQQTGVEFLRRLVKFKKNITFATKAEITDETARALSEIYLQLRQQGKYLCGVVSMSSWDLASRLEPNAPEPNRRLNTIRCLHTYEVPGIIVLRPLLPFVPTEELKKVLYESKKANAQAAVIGGFYLDKEGDILNSLQVAGFPVDKSAFGDEKLNWTTDPEDNWLVFMDPRINELFDYARSIELLPFNKTIDAANNIMKERDSK